MEEFDVTIGDKSIFTFVNRLDFPYNPETIRLGRGGQILEITVEDLDNYIRNGVCVLCHNLQEKNIELPPVQTLKRRYAPGFFLRGHFDYKYAGNFEIFFNRNEVVVILYELMELMSDISDITAYSASNRLTFYYRDDFEGESMALRCIKISDLTEEEYEFLKKEQEHPGAYMKAICDEPEEEYETLSEEEDILLSFGDNNTIYGR